MIEWVNSRTTKKGPLTSKSGRPQGLRRPYRSEAHPRERPSPLSAIPLGRGDFDRTSEVAGASSRSYPSSRRQAAHPKWPGRSKTSRSGSWVSARRTRPSHMGHLQSSPGKSRLPARDTLVEAQRQDDLERASAADLALDLDQASVPLNDSPDRLAACRETKDLKGTSSAWFREGVPIGALRPQSVRHQRLSAATRTWQAI